MWTIQSPRAGHVSEHGDRQRDPHMQTFVVYPGRNLLCPCRLKGCYITVTSIERDTLIRMENGKEHRMNLQLYQGGLDKTYIPTLKDICVSNIYSLNWDFLFGTSHTFLPKSIIENPTRYIKRCVESAERLVRHANRRFQFETGLKGVQS